MRLTVLPIQICNLHEDGVVTGFYTFTSANMPSVVTGDAATLTPISSYTVTTYEVVDSGTVSLEDVRELQGERYVSLYRTNALGDAAQLL
jgi:hypothetical protein